ncbi:MAG: FecCD family ABC transporter permease [Bacteroidaceae bacterium]
MRTRFFVLTAMSLALFCADVVWGSISIPMREVWHVLTGEGADPVYREILWNHRLPKALTAVLTGASLSVAGLMMQTLFRNPLAGPDVLGVTSGAGLGVALLTLGGASLPWFVLVGWGQVAAATIGAVLVLLLVVLASVKVPQTVTLLIIGMMFGHFAGAIVSILQSSSNPDTLKLFITWTFGSLSAVGWDYLAVLFPTMLLGACIAFALQKRLNALLLGENYAAGLGVSVFRTRLWVILATALLAGTSTAFTGPIAFVGVTIPHVARGFFRTANHAVLLPASWLCGAAVMLACDLVSQLPGAQGTLPINSITALFGAPLVVWTLLKMKN